MLFIKSIWLISIIDKKVRGYQEPSRSIERESSELLQVATVPAKFRTLTFNIVTYYIWDTYGKDKMTKLQFTHEKYLNKKCWSH